MTNEEATRTLGQASNLVDKVITHLANNTVMGVTLDPDRLEELELRLGQVVQDLYESVKDLR